MLRRLTGIDQLSSAEMIARPRGDDGQGAVMVIGLLVMTMLIAGLAIDTTRMIIVRRDLQNACDAGVLAGASVIDVARFRTSGGTEVVLSPQPARIRAGEVIADQAPRGHHFEVRASTEDVAARVSARVELRFLVLAGFSETVITAKCRAVPHSPAGS